MEFHQLVTDTIADTKTSLWPAFAPELSLCAAIFLMLLVRLFRWGSRFDASLLAFAGAVVALYFAAPWQHLSSPDGIERSELFTGMLVHDAFSIYMRAVLMFFAVLFAVFTRISGIPDRDDGPDFYCLVLGSTLGMCLMASANHLLVIFLAVEMASVPSYALAAMLKGRREASEAALKYSVYGAGAAGIMLYGISLIGGIVGSAHLPTIAQLLAERMPELIADQRLVLMVLALGTLMTLAGVAFKLSAVPFHFWCPDVFEGATAEVNAFLSVASKAAALALLVRVTIGLGVIPDSSTDGVALTTDAAVLMVAEPAREIPTAAESGNDTGVVNADDALVGMRHFLALIVAIMAAVTCTFGNFAAYAQTNAKRLLAYSTIAHAGYMMLPVSAALMLAGVDNGRAEAAIASLAIYIAIYLFMNLGAFAIVAFLRNTLRTEEIDDYAGLVWTSPGVVICFSIILFSLVGLPPLAGFIGKFLIFAALADGYQITGHTFLLILLIIGGINTAISLFYYLRVVKVMTIDTPSGETASHGISLLSTAGIYTVLVTLPLLLLFVKWNELNSWTQIAAQQLF